MPRLQVNILGGFQARLSSGNTLDIAARKTRALLAFLALPAGREHSRDKLMSLLWSDRSNEQARNSLRQALTELGRALGAGETSLLVKGRDTLALDPQAVEVDAVLFEQLAPSDDIDDLRRAAALYAGDLLDGFGIRDPVFEGWLADERQRYRELAISILKKLVGRETGADALAAGQRLLALDPLQEEGHRLLMRLYAEAGETGAALRQYETCRETLRNELGVGPSVETESLHREIRDQSAESKQGSASAFTHDENKPALASKPSIAVLPFTNLGGDPEQQYLSDGITEDIITELSRYRELLVIARTSSFQYRDKAIDMKQIGRELGVEYLVEGSLRKAGNRLRISAQLIETESGSHVWVERYDRSVEDVFAIQDEVTQTVAATLVGRVAASRTEKSRRKPTHLWAAYDCFLQAVELANRYDATSINLFRRAIQLDPLYAQAYAMLALDYLFKFFFDYREETREAALSYAKRALSIDDNDGLSQAIMGMVQTFLSNWDLAGMHLERAINLNPNNVQFACVLANLLVRVDRTREALENLDAALQRDPLQPPWYWEARGMVLLQEKRYEDAIKATSRKNPLQSWDHATLAVAHAYLGRDSEARREAAIVLRMQPNFSIAGWAKTDPYRNPEHLEHTLEGLRRAGLPE